MAPALAKALRGLASVEYTRNYAQVDNNLDMVDELLRVGGPFFGEDGLGVRCSPAMISHFSATGCRLCLC